MVAVASAPPVRRAERLFAELAVSAEDIREAQALRYRVFAEELGAKIKTKDCGLDGDEYDGDCHHLVVRDAHSGSVVGCTRLITDEQAAAGRGFYSASEFELDPILQIAGRRLEIGRTCIAPDYRQGPAIAVLWSGLAGFIHLHGFSHVFGCASFPLGEQDLQAAAIMNRLRRQFMAPAHLHVRPRQPLRVGPLSDEVLDAPLPPLLRAYVRLGAKVCGEPYRDADFGVADVLMLLRVEELNPAYSRHFLERVAQP